MRVCFICCGLIAATILTPSFAAAQQAGNRGNTGGGASGFGSTGTSGFGSGSSGFGGTGSGLGGAGASGFGSSGFGAQQGGFGQQQGLGGQSGFGNQQGANANNFLGRNTNQNQLLGRNVANQGIGGNNGLGNIGGGNRGGGNRGNGLNSLNQNSGGGNISNQTPIVRPRQKVAFDYPIPTSSAIQSTLETRLTKLSVKLPGLNSVTLAIEEKGEVVLRGEVASASEAKLAENILRLEPGVRTIRNELTYPAADEKSAIE